MEDLAGRQLGNYRLVRLIGQGGFAEVYLGEHIYLDTEAAIKVLRTRLASDEVDQFRVEARTIARLVHPHIVRVLDFGVQDTMPFLVIDYAPNGTLRKKHPVGTPLPLATVVSYVRQIASALQYAHNQHVIHRDIKPENMLLGRQDEVLISDFGIALVVSSRSYSTQSKQDLVGTIAYMAPEQIQSLAGPASDQYALGVVVYEWLCGTRPFQGSFTEVAVKHALAPPPMLREKVPTLPPEVEAVVMKALDKNPEARFHSVREFAVALERASQPYLVSPAALDDADNASDVGVSPNASPTAADTIPLSHEEVAVVLPAQVKGVQASTPSDDQLTTGDIAPDSNEVVTPALPHTTALLRAVRRGGISRRAVVLGLIGVAAVGVVGVGIVWVEHMQVSQSSPTSMMESNDALYVYRGHTAQVWDAAWSPNGKRIASASSDKTVQVWDAANGGNHYIYTGHSDTTYAAAWSPDGKRIASASYDRTVQVWDAGGGSPFTYSGHSLWVWTVRWSPDGARIASAGGDKTVQVWDSASGRHLLTYAGHAGSVFSVAWSPDGRYIVSTGADGTAQVWDATNGMNVYTYQPYAAPLLWSAAWSPDGTRIATAASDKTVQLWDAIDGGHLYVYYGHSDTVYSAAWSPDGKRIVSAGDDRTAQVWNVADGSQVEVYNGHANSIRSVAWAGDGKRVASASWDKTIQVWRV